MLALWGANLSVAVWVGFIALFGVADDGSVVMLTFLEDKFKERDPQTSQEIRDDGHRGRPEARPALPDDDRDDGLRPAADLPDARPRLGRDAADGHPDGRRHGRELITLFIVPCLFCAVEEWKWKRKLMSA